MFRILVFGLLLASAAASGASAQSGRTFYGAGLEISCGAWGRYRAAKNAEKLAEARAWISGFLSGYNMASTGTDFLDAGVDSEEFADRIDQFCKSSSPNQGLVMAVLKLKDELLARARK